MDLGRVSRLRRGRGGWGLNLFPIELCLVQLRIQSSHREQLLVRAAFDNLPSIHHQNQICRQNCGQAMGNDDAGTARWMKCLKNLTRR